MTNLDLDAYQGMWYTVKRDDAKNPMYMSRCPFKTFTKTDNGSGKIHAQAHGGPGKGYKHFDADVVECGQHEDSTCLVSNAKWKNKKYPFTLLATDYTNYDVYYFCYPFAYNSMNFQTVIIGSRTKHMPEGEKLDEVKRVIREAIPAYDLDTYDQYSGELHEDWCSYDDMADGAEQ